MNLEVQVRRIQDRIDILQTLYAYCRHADCRQAEEMVSAFTDDCEVSLHVDGSLTFVGKEAFLKSRRISLARPICGSHYVTNVEMTWDTDDVVRAYAYMYSWQRFKEYPERADCHRFGRYEIRFHRSPVGWKFSRLNLLSAGEYGGSRIGEILGRPFPPQFD